MQATPQATEIPEIPEHYNLTHQFYKLISKTPVKAHKNMGRTIKTNMFYVVYRQKETDEQVAIELGLTKRSIQLRLNHKTQDSKRKVRYRLPP